METDSIDQSIQIGEMRLPIRLYRGADVSRSAPLVLHLHGGSFVDGSLDSGRMVASLLARAGAVVISASYPLATECQFPKPLQVSFAALNIIYGERGRWASKKSNLYVAGEEAGGNIAAGLALMSRDQAHPPIAGQILLSPMLDPCMATQSVREADMGPVGCRWADGWHKYLGSADKACHPYATPLSSSRLAKIAPALILTAEDDPLQDECLHYAERLRNAGICVQAESFKAPTGWPDTLRRFDKTKPPWATALCERFVGFFAQTASLGKNAPQYTSGKA